MIDQQTVKLKRAKAFDMQFWWLVDWKGTIFNGKTMPKNNNLDTKLITNHTISKILLESACVHARYQQFKQHII